MFAVWGTEYDYVMKEEYKCPVCPKCEEQLIESEGKYYCMCCTEEVEVADPEMKEWLDERA